jgi:uncharacterized protein (DUF433 family)
MERKFNRITFDSNKMNGQPCIRGMRLTVKRVLEIVSLYHSRQEIFHEFPELEEDDIKQSLEYASLLIHDKIIPMSMVA